MQRNEQITGCGLYPLKKEQNFLAPYGYDVCIGNLFSCLTIQFHAKIQYLRNVRFPVMFMGILTAVFCSLFIGTEYSDGTIRNKLIVGHSRKSIYLSNLILCTAAGAAISISYMTACLIAGLPLIGSFQMGTKAAVILMLCSIVITTTYTALFTLASMLIHNKAILSIVTVISAFMLLMTASYIYASLSQPEMYTDYIMNESGEVTQSEPVPNTHYVRGAKREVYEFLMEFLPSGQDLMIISAEAPIERMVIYDLCIITASTGLGLWGFLKKDIK